MVLLLPGLANGHQEPIAVQIGRFLWPEIQNVHQQRCSKFSWSAPLILQCSLSELIPWCAKSSLQRNKCTGQLAQESGKMGTGLLFSNESVLWVRPLRERTALAFSLLVVHSLHNPPTVPLRKLQTSLATCSSGSTTLWQVGAIRPLEREERTSTLATVCQHCGQFVHVSLQS